MRGLKYLLANAACALSVSALAGIKYWDNPAYRAFDVDCYVPGAVWNLDGIRNAGATEAHDPTALTWKNLGSSRDSNDVYLRKNTGSSSWAAASAEELSAGTYGEWAENGFVFKGNSQMRADSPKRIDTGTKYTIQFLIDAKTADQTVSNAAVFNSSWQKFTFLVLKNSNQLIWKTPMSYSDSNNHGAIVGDSFDYATAIANGDDGTTAFFSGTEAPVAGDGYRKYSSITKHGEAGYAFGSSGDSNYLFKGTLKSFRYYQKVLSNEELAWNRVVDERRFFDRAAPLPVTNAVVVSEHAANEPAGCYAVDENGYTFTAPRIATVGNAKYICTGYTLETWDATAGDWGAAVFHARELSCAVTDAQCVRITWKWTSAAGLAIYDVNDYVWTGLELFYDGICNIGTNAAHSATALTWKNLGSKGAANDMFLQLLNAAGNSWSVATSLAAVDTRNPGVWTADGFTLAGDSRWRVVNTNGKNGGINTSDGDYSLQTLLDVNATDQSGNVAYVFSLSQDAYSILVRKSGRFDWRSDSATGSSADGPLTMSGTSFDYATCIANKADNTLSLFSGTNFPSSGSGFRQLSSIDGHKENGYDLAGYGNTNYDALLIGILKFFRQYDHALTPEEVAQNRKVDDFRYFGKFAETDVLVQSTYAALQGNEPDGEYDVDVSHTFTAPATATLRVNGKLITYACAGYTVEAQDGLAWTIIDRGDGNSVAIAEDETLKRLTWLWKPVSGIRTADDYSFDDLSQAGLALHYDGLLNQGVGEERSTTSTTWVNLGSRPGMDLTRATSGDDTTKHGSWGEKGYEFTGLAQFNSASGLAWPATFSAQAFIDAKHANNNHGSGNYIAATTWSMFGMQIYGAQKVGRFNVQGTSDITKCPNFATEDGIDYMTAIHDAATKTAVAFEGTKAPTGGSAADGYMHFDTFNGIENNQFRLGGWGGGPNSQNLTGTIYTFRYYDRVLTEEEIIRNRNADAARYFGELGVTNVVYNGTAYKVEGAYTWEAPETIMENGVERRTAGYWLETSDGTKTWHEWEAEESHEFTYDTAERNDAVTLTWGGPRPGLLLIVK